MFSNAHHDIHALLPGGRAFKKVMWGGGGGGGGRNPCKENRLEKNNFLHVVNAKKIISTDAKKESYKGDGVEKKQDILHLPNRLFSVWPVPKIPTPTPIAFLQYNNNNNNNNLLTWYSAF